MNNYNTETFVFDGKLKLFTIVLMAIGAVSLALSYFTGAPELHHMRFWTNYLHNSVFFTGIAFAAVLFISTHALAWGGWIAVFKRIPEAMMNFLYVGILLFALLGIALLMDANGTDLLYMWSNEDYLNVDSPNFDPLAFHKSAFVNPIAYLLTAVVIGSWSIFAYLFRKVSLDEDKTPYTIDTKNPTPKNVRLNRIYAAAFLPIAGFSSAYAIWQWVMSVDTHWYSTLFAWYATVSMFVSMMAMTFMLILFLRSRGLLTKFNDEHMHDIGKYIFGFSVFWTYLWFSQFMLIWYANNGEETQYFFIRFEQFSVVFFANLIINFLLPFFILMINTAKRTLGTLGFVAGVVFFGHWLDFYQMIKPGVWYNHEHAMHLSHAGHGHGDDHKGTDAHSHDHSGDHHTGSTYQMTNQDMPKAVLTGYQEDQNEGEEHHDGDQHDANHGTTETNHSDANHEKDHHEDHSHAAHTEGSHDAHDAHDAHGHAAHGEPPFVIGVHFPGFLEFGTFFGFLGLFLFVTFTVMSRASLYPPNDPYILESEHYDTGIGPERDAH